MSDYIEVPVRVPADLSVNHEVGYMIRDAGREKVHYIPGSQNWGEQVFQQIAAAVEARKPKPPLFQVGDVVEWEHHGQPRAGIVTSTSVVANERLYGVNDGIDCLGDHVLKLVRRAEK